MLAEPGPDRKIRPVQTSSSHIFTPHQWPSGCTLKTDKREVLGLISIKPSRSEISAVFARSSRKYGLGSLRKTPYVEHFTYRVRSHKLTIGLNPTIQPIFCLCPAVIIQFILIKQSRCITLQTVESECDAEKINK